MIGLFVLDVLVVVAVSIGVGASAPRWPARWLRSDPIPLHLWPWETAAFFRRLRVPELARRLPELGALFGGQSKSALPGTTADQLSGYLIEVRRAEWVHWAAIASTLPLYLWSPWWMATVFVVGVSVGNVPFILILRNNRRRLSSIVGRDRTDP